MRVELRDEAREDLFDGAALYGEQSKGLDSGKLGQALYLAAISICKKNLFWLSVSSLPTS
jgi:hypothetical protein